VSDAGERYRLVVPLRKIVGNGEIEVRIDGRAEASQAVTALSTASWTDVVIDFTPSSGKAEVAFVLRETSGQYSGADFAVSNIQLFGQDLVTSPTLLCR
jgi:hypothetical protein